MGFLLLKKILKENLPKEIDPATAVVCGMDEVGRGPWAGPVVACGLILHKDPRIKGLKDSKQLSAQRREQIYEKLKRCAHIGIGKAEAEEIDDLGLTKATRLAFKRALEELTSQTGKTEQLTKALVPDILLIDGRDKLNLPILAKSIIKGDEKVKVIACASIVAKVERDRIMCKAANKYPEYGFSIHKGYGTARHQKALAKYGVCDIHRKSFKPIAQPDFQEHRMLKTKKASPARDDAFKNE